MRNKKLINRGNDMTQEWQFCSPKKKEKVITTRGIRIWSPIQVICNFLKRTKHVAVLAV